MRPVLCNHQQLQQGLACPEGFQKPCHAGWLQGRAGQDRGGAHRPADRAVPGWKPTPMRLPCTCSMPAPCLRPCRVGSTWQRGVGHELSLSSWLLWHAGQQQAAVPSCQVRAGSYKSGPPLPKGRRAHSRGPSGSAAPVVDSAARGASAGGAAVCGGGLLQLHRNGAPSGGCAADGVVTDEEVVGQRAQTPHRAGCKGKRGVHSGY